MRAVSAAWLRTVQGSFTPVYQAVLCSTFQTGADPQGERLPIVDGQVHLDALAVLYATGMLTVPGDLWPDVRSAEGLAPYGTEIYMRAGVKYSDALVEWRGYGYLRIRDLRQPDAEAQGPITLTLEDRFSGVAKAGLLVPRRYAADDSAGYMLSDLVLDVYPEATIEWVDEGLRDAPLGREVLVQDDRLGGVLSLMQSLGQTARWDHRGVLVVRPAPLALAAPVATLHNGRGGVLVSLARNLTDAQVVNAVVARGDATTGGTGPYGVAIDDNTDSPTRYSGRFGPAVKSITSSLIKTDAQASNAALAELNRRAGLLYSLELETSPRFEFEPDDAVQVLGREEAGTHLLSSLTVPFKAGEAMSSQTRQRSVTNTGSAVVVA